MKQATCHPERPHLAKGLCGACYAAAWQAAHPDYWGARYAGREEYYRTRYAANKGRIAIQQQAYRLANREKEAATRRTWCAANPERQLGYNRLRRARKFGAIGSITSDQWASIKATHAWRCAYCGKIPASLTQDHVIPLALGGSHTPANIVPACLSCNSRKGNRPPTRLPAKRLLI